MTSVDIACSNGDLNRSTVCSPRGVLVCYSLTLEYYSTALSILKLKTINRVVSIFDIVDLVFALCYDAIMLRVLMLLSMM